MALKRATTSGDAVFTMVAVTPTDGAQDLTAAGDGGGNGGMPTGLLLGADGDVKITDGGGNDVVLPGLKGGVFHRIAFTKVFATGTAAEVISAGVVAGYV